MMNSLSRRVEHERWMASVVRPHRGRVVGLFETAKVEVVGSETYHKREIRIWSVVHSMIFGKNFHVRPFRRRSSFSRLFDTEHT